MLTQSQVEVEVLQLLSLVGFYCLCWHYRRTSFCGILLLCFILNFIERHLNFEFVLNLLVFVSYQEKIGIPNLTSTPPFRLNMQWSAALLCAFHLGRTPPNFSCARGKTLSDRALSWNDFWQRHVFSEVLSDSEYLGMLFFLALRYTFRICSTNAPFLILIHWATS